MTQKLMREISKIQEMLSSVNEELKGLREESRILKQREEKAKEFEQSHASHTPMWAHDRILYVIEYAWWCDLYMIWSSVEFCYEQS